MNSEDWVHLGRGVMVLIAFFGGVGLNMTAIRGRDSLASQDVFSAGCLLECIRWVLLALCAVAFFATTVGR